MTCGGCSRAREARRLAREKQSGSGPPVAWSLTLIDGTMLTFPSEAEARQERYARSGVGRVAPVYRTGANQGV